MKNEAAEANARLAQIRAARHNGRMYQADDVDYMLALAVEQGRGLGAINPQWFRDQAKLIRGTLDFAERAVVALHMFRHAGLNRPGFEECREGLCGEWHAMQSASSAPSAVPPAGEGPA